LSPFDVFLPIWNPFLVQPIETALRFFTELTGSAGLAIIILTIGIRTAMLPLTLIQVRSQKAMQRMQPQLKELQQKYGSDRQRMAQEQMRLYRENGVNPAAGCLPLVLQMPIWFALYAALNQLAATYPPFQEGFLWIPSLAHSDPYYILPVITGVTQWVVQRMSMLPTTDPQQQQMNRMMEFMPLMFFFFSLQVASGLALYWVVSNVYTFFQQYFMVGWGTLPFLGSGGSSSGGTPASPNNNGGKPSNGTAGPVEPRRKGAGSSARRRKK
jgi:YidC/Oxa1 family membrane protein insertase